MPSLLQGLPWLFQKGHRGRNKEEIGRRQGVGQPWGVVLVPPLPLSRETWWRCSVVTPLLDLFSHFTFPVFWPDAELPLGLSQRDFIPSPSWFVEAFTKGNEEESLPTGQSMALCAPRLWQFRVSLLCWPHAILARPGFWSMDRSCSAQVRRSLCLCLFLKYLLCTCEQHGGGHHCSEAYSAPEK